MDFWRRGRQGGDAHREFLSSWVSEPDLVPSRHCPKWAPAAPWILPRPADVSPTQPGGGEGFWTAQRWEPAGDRGWQGRSEGHFLFWTSFKNFSTPPPPPADRLCCPTQEGTLRPVEPSPGTRHRAKRSLFVFSLNPRSYPMRWVLTLTPFSSKEARTEVEDSVLTHPKGLLSYSSLPPSKKGCRSRKDGRK